MSRKTTPKHSTDQIDPLIIGGNGVDEVRIGSNLSLVLIGGPCAIESESHALKIAESLKSITEDAGVPFIYKSCYDKDSRSSGSSYLGIGIDEGLRILEKVRNEVGVPVTSDFSVPDWAEPTADVVDLLQIPAFLCRQTQILFAAGKTRKPINIKKGQFMSPQNMRNSVEKIRSRGNPQIMLTERGTFFGYNMLVNDYKALKVMSDLGYPVCYDATHSVQRPTHLGTVSEGQREFIPSLVRAAAGSGIQALFMEIHDDPDNALSDPATQIDIKFVPSVIRQAKAIHELRIELLEKYGEDSVV